MIDDCILTLLLGCRSSTFSQFSIPYVVEGGVRVSILSDFSLISYPESYPGTDPGAQKKENPPLQAQAPSLSLRSFGLALSERLKWRWNRTDSLSTGLPDSREPQMLIEGQHPPERPDIIIIICLSYPGTTMIGQDGTLLKNSGGKANLQMLLFHLDYRHSTDYSRFRIISDFDCEFRDSGGLRAFVPRIPATRQNIKSAIKTTMLSLEKNGRCLVYYSGSIIAADTPESYQETDFADPQLGNIHLVVNLVERIGNWELRRWLSRSRFPSSTIVVVLDTPKSGGFLDLQYSYELSNGDLEVVTRPGRGDLESLVIEISAARYNEYCWNQLIKCDDGAEIRCSVLTLYLLRYLRGNELPNIRDLVSYLYTTCYSHVKAVRKDLGEQTSTPLISSSKKLEGQLALF